MQTNANIPVLTEVVDPDEVQETTASAAADAGNSEIFHPDDGPSLDLEKITCTLCEEIAEQIEGELRLQLEARLNQALESAMPQIRQEVREILKTHLGDKSEH